VQITHVLSLGGAEMLEKLRSPLHERGLKHLCVEMSDTSTQDLSGHFETCLSFIATGLAEVTSNDTSGGDGVLVHCFQGKSRSAGATYSSSFPSLTFSSQTIPMRNSVLCMSSPFLSFRDHRCRGGILDVRRGTLIRRCPS